MYDAKTENGIPYISTLYALNYRYETVVNDLDALYPTKQAALGAGNVTEYSIGDRSLKRNGLSASEILKQWDKLMALKARLERGDAPRKAVGIVHRDW